MTVQSWVTTAICMLLTGVFALITVASGIVASIPGFGDFRGFSLMVSILAFVFTIGCCILAIESAQTDSDDVDA